MKFLLAAINAKYIHSNLGVYSLKAYAKQECQCPEAVIEIGEYTINHQMDSILKDIFLKKPDVVGFSCYIWNISYVLTLARDLQKVLPHVEIWLGGPEVSYRAEALLKEEPHIRGIMMGEGEETFAELVSAYEGGNWEQLFAIAGTAVHQQGEIVINPMRPPLDMNRIPFVYDNLEQYEHRIIYYESSRGCPFSCSYCLSSIDKSVRFRDLQLVKAELDFFLEHRVPQVKFVDRTFNCKKSHSMAIWHHILDHDNGITNFHFEVSGDILDEEELELLSRMRPGLVQLEIGVQSTNSQTISEIHRTMDLGKLKEVVRRINGFGNIHQHLDLIAGLPYEDYESFTQSFHEVYEMEPEQLQLGFLKVLSGSYMELQKGTYGLRYSGQPPYEVLSTSWLSYGDIVKLKAVEEMVEVYYNSSQYRNTLKLLEKEFDNPFFMFEQLAKYYEEQKLFGISHNRLARYEILHDFICRKVTQSEEKQQQFVRCLMYDLYLRENVKSRPAFAPDQTSYKGMIKEFFMEEAVRPRYLKGYEQYDSRQMSKIAHLEVMNDGTAVLFDYLNRDPLTYNGTAYVILGEDFGDEVPKHR